MTYAAADNPEFTIMIDERRCVDPQSGSLFAYTVEVRSEGRAFARLRRAQSGHAGAVIAGAGGAMDDIERLRDLIGSAKRIVAFTGAGISTESGIPDFRSPGGIWTKYKPIYFDDFMASDEMRRESWRRKFATDETMLKAEPNAGHRALAKLVEQGTHERHHHPERRWPAPALGRARFQGHRAARQHDLRELPGLRPSPRAGADQEGVPGQAASCRSARSATAS